MTQIAQALSGALVEFVWQGMLVALLLWIALYLLRHGSAGVRYGVCCSALCALLILPAITAYSLYDSGAVAASNRDALTITIRAVWTGTISSSPAWVSAVQPMILWIWLPGVLYLSLRLAWAGGQLSVMRQSAVSADPAVLAIAAKIANKMGTCRAVRVLVASYADGPSLAGWIRPAILLPAATIFNLTPQQLEAVLAHEIAHLRRYDDVVNIIQVLVETLLFYHPAAWWVSGRIRHERELCCDDLAVTVCGDALCYARALTTMEKLRAAAPRLALGACDGPLAYRIKRIVGSRTRGYLSSSLAGVAALVLAMGFVVLNTDLARGDTRPAPAPARVEYPEAARTRGIQGTVPVEVKVDQTGKVSEAHAVGGPFELRNAAVDKASSVQFDTGTEQTTQVDVAFRLTAQAAKSAPRASDAMAIGGAAGTVDGTVIGDDGKATPGGTVALIPESPSSGQTDLYQATSTDQNGKFSITSIPPGKYRIYAWEELNHGTRFDPDILEGHQDRGAAVTVVENGHARITLIQIPGAGAHAAPR